MSYIIHIPNWHPTSDNKLQSSHWTASRQMKNVDTQMIRVYAHKLNIPPATGRRQVEIILYAQGRGRRPDPTNYYKSTMDALNNGKLLIDDSQKWMEHLPTKIMPGKKATTIILTDLP